MFSFGPIATAIGGGLDFLGSMLGNKQQEDIANRNIQMQEEFAQKGIQWRVADAEKAGLSPLAALGASEPSFSPVAQVFDSPVSALGRDFGRMGQDSFRAAASEGTDLDRQLQVINLRRGRADADAAETAAAISKVRLNQLLHPPSPAKGEPDSITFVRPDGTTYSMPSPMRVESGRGVIGGNMEVNPSTFWPVRMFHNMEDAILHLAGHGR